MGQLISTCSVGDSFPLMLKLREVAGPGRTIIMSDEVACCDKTCLYFSNNNWNNAFGFLSQHAESLDPDTLEFEVDGHRVELTEVDCPHKAPDEGSVRPSWAVITILRSDAPL